MARPLRLEFASAIYHVTSRGDRRENIYLTDEDRQDWLDVLRQTCERYNWVVHAWCQMSNHYHLLVETVDGNLSRGMRQLNGQYTQRFNQRHPLVGHLFQGGATRRFWCSGKPACWNECATWCSIRCVHERSNR